MGCEDRGEGEEFGMACSLLDLSDSPGGEGKAVYETKDQGRF